MFRCLQFDFRSRCVLASVLTDRIRVNEALNSNTNVHIHIYIFILHIPYTIYMQIILIFIPEGETLQSISNSQAKLTDWFPIVTGIKTTNVLLNVQTVEQKTRLPSLRINKPGEILYLQ